MLYVSLLLYEWQGGCWFISCGIILTGWSDPTLTVLQFVDWLKQITPISVSSQLGCFLSNACGLTEQLDNCINLTGDNNMLVKKLKSYLFVSDLYRFDN